MRRRKRSRHCKTTEHSNEESTNKDRQHFTEKRLHQPLEQASVQRLLRNGDIGRVGGTRHDGDLSREMTNATSMKFKFSSMNDEWAQ
jgi:hypothetical protein